MTHIDSSRSEAAYALATQSLLTYADDDSLGDGIFTLEQYRAAYESVRTELLETFDDLDGPVIGDLLGEAAGEVWPSVSHLL